VIRAVRGEWWRGPKSGIYCVGGTETRADGLASGVVLYWVSGHTPPQVHRQLWGVNAWKHLTTKGARLAGPPDDPAKAAAVARVLELLS